MQNNHVIRAKAIKFTPCETVEPRISQIYEITANDPSSTYLGVIRNVCTSTHTHTSSTYMTYNNCGFFPLAPCTLVAAYIYIRILTEPHNFHDQPNFVVLVGHDCFWPQSSDQSMFAVTLYWARRAHKLTHKCQKSSQ